MIGWLIGTVRRRDPASGSICLDVQGVGYELQVSIQTLGSIPDVGERCELHVHTHVREDALALFGFGTAEERRLFLMLTSVPKVGPRNALAVLGGFPVAELVNCIAGEHAGKLVKIPGIGKRTAEQIILTLKDKMLPFLATLEDGPEPIPDDDEAEGEGLEEAKSILLSLGWKAKPVEKALSEVEAREDANLDEIVRLALAKLMDR